MYKFVVVAFLALAAVSAQPTPDTGDLDCLQQEALFSCIAIKAVSSINRASRTANVEIIEGITFIRDADAPAARDGKSLKTETEMLNELPRDLSDRTVKLFNALFESAASFFKSHSLKINVDDGSVSRAFEGRSKELKKLKNLFLPILGAAAIKFVAIIPLLVGGLALFVVKSLVVAKIALLIAGILGFNKFFGAGSAGSIFGKTAQPVQSWYAEQAAPTWSGATAQQGYYARSLNEDAHSMAYSAQKPANTVE